MPNFSENALFTQKRVCPTVCPKVCPTLFLTNQAAIISARLIHRSRINISPLKQILKQSGHPSRDKKQTAQTAFLKPSERFIIKTCLIHQSKPLYSPYAKQRCKPPVHFIRSNPAQCKPNAKQCKHIVLCPEQPQTALKRPIHRHFARLGQPLRITHIVLTPIYYNVYSCAIRSTQDAYMPNAQRKREYLRIYEDVSRKNELLVNYLVRLSNSKKVDELLQQATQNLTANKPDIVKAAMSRWKASGMRTSSRPLQN